MDKVPKLIPIYSHRYIPSSLNEIGNPVYSVHQTDIIYYGKDLWDYFNIAFNEIKTNILFWSELCE